MADEEIRQKLATCARILNRLGMFDLYGHMSARIPGHERFYMTPAVGSTDKMFTPEGLVLCDYTGKKLSGDGTVPQEVVLHRVLHKAREDAACVVHVHPFYSTALAVAGIPFTPVTLQGVFLGESLPVYEKAELIVNDNQGEKLVRTIGKAKAVLLRGHGVITVGESIEEATYHTIYLEENCKFLLEVFKAGTKVIPLTREEIKQNIDHIAERSKKEKTEHLYVYKRIFDLLDRRTR